MLACFDVGYRDRAARAACVTFNNWQDAEPSGEYVVDVESIAPYVPGQFYRRELPCIQAALRQLPSLPQVIVIDGYVWLDSRGSKGLGAYLYEALDSAVPVIGVAKTRYRQAAHAREVLRGKSKRPLLITAVGMDQAEAAECIRQMHGAHRIPSLLKRADQLSRRSLMNQPG